jgi:hypothetical protein
LPIETYQLHTFNKKIELLLKYTNSPKLERGKMS